MTFPTRAAAALGIALSSACAAPAAPAPAPGASPPAAAPDERPRLPASPAASPATGVAAPPATALAAPSPAEPPATERPAGSSPAPSAERVLALLTSARFAVPRSGECALLQQDDPEASFGAILAPYVRDANEREVRCEPDPRGFRCTVSIVRSGDEEDEYGIFLNFLLGADHAIDPATVSCSLAG